MPISSPDHTAVYVAVAGTLGGVALTALFSYFQSRHHHAEETRKQALQLAHERGLSDRADLRAVLASTLDALEAHHRATTSTLRATVARSEASRADAIHALWEATERCNAVTNSLRIRLGDKHPIMLAAAKLDPVLSALTIASESGDQAGHDQATEDRSSAIDEFAAAALAEVGSRTT